MRTLSDAVRRHLRPRRFATVAVLGLAVVLTVGILTVAGGGWLQRTSTGAVRTPCDSLLQRLSAAGASAPEIAKEHGFSPDIPLPDDVAVRTVLCVDSQPAEMEVGNAEVIAFAVVDAPTDRAWLALRAETEAESTEWREWLGDQGFPDAASTEYGYATHAVRSGERTKDLWRAVADSTEVRASIED